MTNVQIEAGTLTANAQDRIVSGLLLPFGEVGNTNLGRFSVEQGVIPIPQDVTVFAANLDHKRESPVARFMTAVETTAGVVASFLVGTNPEGDALLAEIADKNNPEARRNLSVEVADVVIRGGKAIGGKLFGAAFVKAGAFPSATLMAADVGGEPETPAPEALAPDEEGQIEISATETPKTVAVSVGDSKTNFIPKPEEPAVPIPNTLNAAKGKTEKTGLGLAQVATLFAQRAEGFISDAEFSEQLKDQNGNTLFGALSDVKFDGTGGLAPTMGQPQWIGEVWNALRYRQQILPLFAHSNLTSTSFAGFRWGVKPSGGDWPGNKGNVPSNTLTVTPVTGAALRYAVGHDIAREFQDFPVAGFFESYAAAVTEDYAKWADGKVAAAAVAGATPLAADALTTLPGGTANIGAAASAVIDGAVALAATGTLPSFALLAPNLYKSLLKTPQNNVLGYLSAALGLEDGELGGFTIRPSASIAAGKVLVGAKEAVTVYELPGSPVRVDALDLARGGLDKAAFGYLAVNVNDALGLQLVTAATA